MQQLCIYVFSVPAISMTHWYMYTYLKFCSCCQCFFNRTHRFISIWCNVSRESGPSRTLTATVCYCRQQPWHRMYSWQVMSKRTSSLFLLLCIYLIQLEPSNVGLMEQAAGTKFSQHTPFLFHHGLASDPSQQCQGLHRFRWSRLSIDSRLDCKKTQKTAQEGFG